MKQLSLPMSEIYPLIEQMITEGGEAHVTIRGSSMSPFLHDGRDQAVFAPLPPRPIRRGDIVLYQRDGGQFVMHRVYSVDDGGTMTLLGDAQRTLEPGIRPEQLRAFVPRVIRKGKSISCERGLWHRLMTAYMLRIRYPRAARLVMRVLRLPFAVRRRLARLLSGRTE